VGARVVALRVVAWAYVRARQPLEGGIADGAGHVETALAVLDGLCRLALEIVVVDQIGVHAGQPRLVPELAGQALGLARDGEDVVELAELQERRTQGEAQVDRLLDRLPRLPHALERGARVPKSLHPPAVRRVQDGARADLAVVDEGLRPDLASGGVKRELIDMTRAAVVIEPLDRVDDPRVQHAALLTQEARVGDVARERALEAVDDVGEEARLLAESRRLPARPRPAPPPAPHP